MPPTPPAQSLLRPFVQNNSTAAIRYRYWLSVPPDYDKDETKRWPLMLFLHGAGESARGEGADALLELEMVKMHGVPKLVCAYELLRSPNPPTPVIPQQPTRPPTSSRRKDTPPPLQPVTPSCATLVTESFITVSPQLNFSEGGYGWNPHVLSDLLAEIESLYRVDATREYVTGVSMGGYGTWALAMHNPTRFAAIAPVCGGADAARVSVIKDTPVWNHHGAKDEIIPISESDEVIQALKRCGAKEVEYSIYPEAGHDSWTEAYNRIELWEWFLTHQREAK
ncbi:hypothetical protein HDV00_000702 [Rhizophlyctis rosea]|nr:hypothetical protein HDV00_000702 [Rhizophlyctis rosea]